MVNVKEEESIINPNDEAISKLKEDFVENLSDLGVDIKICTHCGKFISSGYIIKEGLIIHCNDIEYYCSDVCRNHTISEKEYLKLYHSGDAYWTTWESNGII